MSKVISQVHNHSHKTLTLASKLLNFIIILSSFRPTFFRTRSSNQNQFLLSNLTIYRATWLLYWECSNQHSSFASLDMVSVAAFSCFHNTGWMSSSWWYHINRTFIILWQIGILPRLWIPLSKVDHIQLPSIYCLGDCGQLYINAPQVHQKILLKL